MTTRTTRKRRENERGEGGRRQRRDGHGEPRKTRYRSQLPARSREPTATTDKTSRSRFAARTRNSREQMSFRGMPAADPTGYRLRSSSFLPVLEPKTPAETRDVLGTNSPDILTTDAHIFPSDRTVAGSFLFFSFFFFFCFFPQVL